jgi:hypothetical protein
MSKRWNHRLAGYPHGHRWRDRQGRRLGRGALDDRVALWQDRTRRGRGEMRTTMNLVYDEART